MPFNGKTKNKVAPIQGTIEQIIEVADEKLKWVSNPRNKAGGKLNLVHKTNIKRQSIMFELPYWQVSEI
jgi:hypothetical protein